MPLGIFDETLSRIGPPIDEHILDALEQFFLDIVIDRELPGIDDAHTSGGISNLSFSFRGNVHVREAMHAAFLYHATRLGPAAGLVHHSTAGSSTPAATTVRR